MSVIVMVSISLWKMGASRLAHALLKVALTGVISVDIQGKRQ
tara:strand:- start:751 stop:876 length:126 start_codon:yes stop_codon:yes gene_type:complete